MTKDKPSSDRSQAGASHKARRGTDPLVGTTLMGEYQIVDLLGEGGMARVYKAIQLSFQRYVAIKTLTSKEPDTVARFANEVKLVSKLKHKNIVQALDCVVEPSSGQVFFVMEYLPGMTMEDLLRNQTRLKAEDDLACIAGQLCDALSFAHSQGVIHRDLKPANVILLEQDGNVIVKVVDFGIARVEADVQRLTQAGVVVGSPFYMSPEQCMGYDLDSRADIYSLGALIYEIITGELPYPEHHVMKVMAAHCDPSRYPASVEGKSQLRNPRQLDQIIKTAMETTLEKRFQTVDQFKEAITFWYRSIKEQRPDLAIPMTREPQPAPVARANITTTESRSLRELVSRQQEAREPSQKLWRSPELFSARSDLETRRTISGATFEQFRQHEPLLERTIQNRYKVLNLIGEGGMAVVYRARNIETQELVAIKTLKYSDPELVARFAREVAIHEQLKHPNIVKSIECIETRDGQAFFVMELLSGIVLQDQIDSKGRINEIADICTILSQILDAMEYAHDKGIIHRDIKSENIIVTEIKGQIRVKVLDFGVARIQEDLQRLTKTGVVLGSPAYMSPEQCMGQALDGRSDLYSLGVVAYEMITGDLPITGATEIEVMDGHCDPTVTAPPLRRYRDDIPGVENLDKIFAKCLSKDPNGRYQSVTELKIDLQQWWQEAIACTNADLSSPFRVSRRKQERTRVTKLDTTKPVQPDLSKELATLVSEKRETEREAFASRFKDSRLPGAGARSLVKPLMVAAAVLVSFVVIYFAVSAVEQFSRPSATSKTAPYEQTLTRTGETDTNKTKTVTDTSEQQQVQTSAHDKYESEDQEEPEFEQPRRKKKTGVRVFAPGQYGQH